MTEKMVQIEAIRMTDVRASNGVLAALAEDILTEGLRHPVALWTDGTIISGGRRVRAHFMRPGMPTTIRAVFVNAIEDAVARLLIDNQDDHLAEPMKPSDICRFWEVIKRLDEPADLKRKTEARRRGAELRKQVLAGERAPGRSANRGDDYATALLAKAFGMSAKTANRLWMIWQMSKSPSIDMGRRNQAVLAMKSLDAGEVTIWACYAALVKGRSAPRGEKPKPIEPASAAKQLAAWDRALPELEGITAGLTGLGRPNSDLTWEQVGPVCARLAAVRRSLEVTIKQMRESSK